jgi:hypothetical protein
LILIPGPVFENKIKNPVLGPALLFKNQISGSVSGSSSKNQIWFQVTWTKTSG